MKDKIAEQNGVVIHESAGGFVFYKDGGRLMVVMIAILDNERAGLYVPKGHVREGEALEAAARREIHEETGADMPVVKCLGRSSEATYEFYEPDDERLHRKTVHFFAFVTDTMSPLEAEDHPTENFTVGWFDAYAVERYMPHQKADFKSAFKLVDSL